jgi:transcriptional regulator with XRE-family HTH domain
MKFEFIDYYRSLGLNIAYYRKSKAFTQEMLAEKVNVDHTHLSKVEAASVGISLDLLFAIAEALEVPPHKLLEFRE